MNNDELRIKAASDQLRLSGEKMTYHSPAGNIVADILIERNIQTIGQDGYVIQSAYAATFTREAIANPRSGEIISSEGNSRWRLDFELSASDRYISSWAIKPI